MGPNLTRLYQELHFTPPSGCSEVDAIYFALQRKFARDTLRALFDTYGEALIMALEQLHQDSMASDFNEHWESYGNAAQLLAQLEQEAQP